MDARRERSTTSWWTSVRKAAGIALTASTLTLTATSGTAAAAAAPQGFVGVSDWGWPTSAQAQRLGADGVGTFRAGVAWSWIEPQQGQRGWGGVDGLMADAATNGYDLTLVLNGCTEWACGATRTAPQTPQQRAFFQDYVRDFVGRYGAGGSFWRTRTDLRAVKVAWQVWNEVNVGADWPNPTAAGYAALLAETSATIKRVDPSATVVSAGLAELPAVPEGATLAEFLTALESNPAFRSSADVVAVHGYAENALGTARVLDTARAIMHAAGDTRPLWVTEVGWGSGGPAHAFVRDDAGQAAELRSAYDLMTACRNRWGLDKAIWFALRDVSSAQLGEADYWGMHTGLYGADGTTPKLAAAALREYAGGRTLPAGRAAACPLAGGDTPAATVSTPVAGAGGPGAKTPRVTVVQAPQLVGAAALAGRDADGNPVRRAQVDFVTDMGDGVAAQCSLDGGPWTPCATPFVIPAGSEGRHALAIRALTPQGAVSPVATASWTIDVTAPSTAFRAKPPRKVRGRVVKIKVGLEEAVRAERQARKEAKAARKRANAARKRGRTARKQATKRAKAAHSAALQAKRNADAAAERVSYECALNRGEWKPCGATIKLKTKSAKGKQRLQVRAIDAAGNVDPTPARATFRVTRR